MTSTSFHVAVHQSLARPQLIAGAERPLVILEGVLVAVLLIGVGFYLLTVALSLVIVFMLHPLLVIASKRDPQVFAVYVRSLRYASYYAAAAHPAARPAHAQPLVYR